MDPIATAAATAAGLFATKLLEEAGSQAGKTLSAATGRVVAWVHRRGREDPETGAAVTLLQARPDDPARVELLGQVLAVRARDNSDLARELAELVHKADQGGDVQLRIGGTHIDGGVSGQARVIQVGRDQITLPDDEQP